jgi:hypothetical protein
MAIAGEGAGRPPVQVGSPALAGPVKTIGLPIKFSSTPGAVLAPAPLFGEHTCEVLADAGYSAAEIASLFDAGAACGPVAAKDGETQADVRQETPARRPQPCDMARCLRRACRRRLQNGLGFGATNWRHQTATLPDSATSS